MLRLASLSERERQIMVRVAMGNIYPENGSIVCIENHREKAHEEHLRKA